MRHRSTTHALTLLALPALALAGCSSSTTPPAICPESGIIHGLDRVARVAGDAAIRANLENVDGICSLDGQVLKLEMTVDIVADAPAGTPIPYFVVITDPAGEVLDKAAFTATLPDPITSRPVRLREQLQQEITGVAPGTSADYAVLFGLELPTGTALEQRSFR